MYLENNYSFVLQMKKLFLIIFTALLVVSVVVPLLLNTSSEDAVHVIDHISFIIAAFCGIITTIIAILLYDKYGVDKKIIDKNLEVVLQFVDELRKTTIYIYGESTKGGSYAIMVNFWNKPIEKDDFMSRCLNDRLFFKLNYVYALNNLYEISKNPFMPPEISEKFQRIALLVLPEITEEDKRYGYAVATSSVNMLESEDKDQIIGKLNGHDFSVGEYIDNYMEVRSAIKQWLKAHNVDDGSLNF